MVDAAVADGRRARAWAGHTALHGTRGTRGTHGGQGMGNILELHEFHVTWDPNPSIHGMDWISRISCRPEKCDPRLRDFSCWPAGFLSVFSDTD